MSTSTLWTRLPSRMCAVSIRLEEFIIRKDGTDGIHGTVQECTYLGLNTHYTIEHSDQATGGDHRRVSIGYGPQEGAEG
ncbi:MAG: TOBE domain-containing protein [Faecalibacterium prausnitzii]